jgi:glutamine synthetase
VTRGEGPAALRTHILFADPGGSARQKIVHDSARPAGFCATVLLHTLHGVNGVIPGYGTDSGHASAMLEPGDGQPRSHWRPGASLTIADIRGLDGVPHPLCSRSILKAWTESLRAEGQVASIGLELEFYLIPEARWQQVLRRRWSPRAIPRRMYGPLDDTAPVSAVLDEIMTATERCGLRVEAVHREFENFQYEFSFAPSDPVNAADEALIFRELVKSVARGQRVHACFMPKPFTAELGSGMHVNVSLRPADGAAGPAPGPTAGQLASVTSHFPACCLIWNPTVNSYRRLNGADFSSVSSPAADDRRDTLLRVARTGDPGQQRLEFRLPDAACNPYTSLALCLLLLRPGTPAAAGPAAGEVKLPSSLAEAMAAFGRNPLISQAFPGDFSAAFLQQKAEELGFYRTAVPDIDFLLQMPELFAGPDPETPPVTGMAARAQ